jgi:hypothetical protein
MTSELMVDVKIRYSLSLSAYNHKRHAFGLLLYVFFSELFLSVGSLIDNTIGWLLEHTIHFEVLC